MRPPMQCFLWSSGMEKSKCQQSHLVTKRNIHTATGGDGKLAIRNMELMAGLKPVDFQRDIFHRKS